MALTPAERQAARRDRLQASLDDLTSANSVLARELAQERNTSTALRAEAASLRSELEALKNRLQAAEMASLKAQVRELKKTAQKPS